MKLMLKGFFVLAACLLVLFSAGCGTQGVSIEDSNINQINLSGQNQGGSEAAAPVTKSDGSKFRIAIIDIDPDEYACKLIFSVIEGLKSEGWVQYDALPFTYDETDTRSLIGWLAEQDLGPYIEFSKDTFYYLAVDGEDTVRENLKAQLDAGEIDLIFAAGTWPSRVATDLTQDVPIVAYPLSDPVASGIVKASDYSGVKNVWAQTDPTKYQRQMRVFYEIYKFADIGSVFYDESVSGYLAYKTSCDELGVKLDTIQINPLPSNPSEADTEAFNRNFLDGCRALADKGIDAFLLTADMIKTDTVFTELKTIFDNAEIPIFVQSGDWVARGCLLTVSTYDAKELGLFVTNAIGQIFNGEAPDKILQEYVSTPYLILNMDSVKKLGIMPPFEMLISCEKIYSSENAAKGAD